MSDNYKVNLEIFEGPLDLLLFLIRKNHLDIYDIHVALLLEEYIKFIDTLKELDIDVAAEFLLMAAELTHIKSQMLLPRENVEMLEEEGDPRADLVQRLIDYQRYKEVANTLEKRPQLGKDVFSPNASLPDEERPISAEIDSLWKSFVKLIERLPAETAHEIKIEHISVGARILELIDKLKPGRSISWEEILPTKITKMVKIKKRFVSK